MLSRQIFVCTIVTLLALLFSACVPMPPADSGDVASAEDSASREEMGFRPSAAECIAPANPGGGWDFTCRSVTKVMSDLGLVDGTIQVTNMAGGGGGVALAHVVSERNEDDNLIIAASPATTLRLAQGQYGDFTEESVRWLGVVGADFAVLAVNNDSPYESLDDLVAALRADPASVNFGGGSAVGGQDHLKAMILAQSAEIDPLSLRYTPFDGGGEALTALLGGFIDVFPGDASEVLGQLEAGEIRILATLTPERLAEPFADTSTATELGYAAEWIVFRGFYAPGGMSDEAYDWWVSTLETLVASDEWVETASQGGLDPFFMGGDAFQQMIVDQIVNFRQLSIDLGIIE